MDFILSSIVLVAILNTATAVEPCSEEYKPVDCGQFAPHVFDNICLAEKAGFDPERCLELIIDEPNEYEECTYGYPPVICGDEALSNLCDAEKYGADFGQYVTPRVVANNEDAIVWYICDHDGWQTSSLPIKATLTASGLLDYFPVPVRISVEYDENGDDNDSLQLLNIGTDPIGVKNMLANE
ncbi:hypothetical protein FRACYDRAFT_250392 [Fragilariopsis cylindrus CCMP1102]|uniref:Kazal-like domain-containing protein n=1 Tax=Fragilariopsis cylindrus CCMP1102 TaxID=635003 RepID=A0A1E7ERI5_9STRA|nr:hypothetical protein FRACYDRAFT_250392 [Fragilariopsis cylindrus CCMP1102]|eukprot:OEU08163.1 hypothetical protein FRACYDRAFT_250392 [Fragilariopsis cylindrus CCMP1102]